MRKKEGPLSRGAEAVALTSVAFLTWSHEENKRGPSSPSRPWEGVDVLLCLGPRLLRAVGTWPPSPAQTSPPAPSTFRAFE